MLQYNNKNIIMKTEDDDNFKEDDGFESDDDGKL